MATLNTGAKTTVDVPIGKVLTVSGGGQGSVVRLASPGSGEPMSPVPFVGQTLTFGPYGSLTLYRIECNDRSIDYNVDYLQVAPDVPAGGLGWQ